MASMMSPKDHIDEIRRNKFSIGGEPNSLREDLHQAVKNLSAELYSKDVHFLMELIQDPFFLIFRCGTWIANPTQNAEDNEYSEGVEPSLEFVITSKDITETGSEATLLIFNNEKGFSRKNVDSICSVGRSTKKGNRKSGYIGEKGIGFKSVFLITAQPYIFSNGYQIRFSEEPCLHCSIGYIVPEWVDESPLLARIKQIYGSSAKLPTTTIVLPLKSDKVAPVKQQLSSVHPELLLFLSKIRKLSVREENENPNLNTVSAISISSEKDLVRKKNIDAESYLLVLSADEKLGGNGECSYHMWRQRFPVKQECRVGRRNDVDEWVITLAFPYGERLNRGSISPGIYAFLPTEMVTNFPFIIQADFLLSSSREAILLDDKWNKGILSCVSSAFLAAFTSLVKANQEAPTSTLINMFNFLPVKDSAYSCLNAIIKDSIREKLLGEDIMPCESYTTQKIFRKPSQVYRLKPSFWKLLNKARKQGVTLHNISSHGKYILNNAFDQDKWNHTLKFLDVKYVEDDWYWRCIQSSDLVLGVSEDLYLELLLFVAENWSSFSKTNMVKIPLLKYLDSTMHVALCSVSSASTSGHLKLLLCTRSNEVSWLTSWNKEFHCVKGYFIAETTQEAYHSNCSKWQDVLNWLQREADVESVDVYDYADLIHDSLSHDQKLVIAYAHFIYHSHKREYLSANEINSLCSDMPLVDNYGHVATKRNGVVVPANGSKWVQLIGSSNPWKRDGYIELGQEYLTYQTYADVSTKKGNLLPFLETYAGVLDIPNLPPPDAILSSMFSPLTKNNAFLLLDWIDNMQKKSIPARFLTCIREGSWLRVRLCGNPGYRPPSQSFFHSSSWGDHLQNGSLRMDIPLVDQAFYGDDISDYKEALKTAGVMFEFKDACEFIGKHFMSLVDSSMSSTIDVISMLKFIRYLRAKYLPPDDFINSVKDKSWLHTTLGKRSPGQSVFLDQEWTAASQISNIPFVDENHYGKDIVDYKEELKLLGVIFGFNQNFQLVVSNMKPSEKLASISAEAALLALNCIHHLSLDSSSSLCMALKGTRCLKTVNSGYRAPAECFLPDPTWISLVQVFDSFPIIDEKFYGSKIVLFKNELKSLGVVVSFEDVIKSFAKVFREQTSKCALSKSNALSFLACYKKLKATGFSLQSHDDVAKCIQEVKWLRSRLGVSCTPKECILFGKDWEPISSVSLLPFLDDAYYGQDIHEYKAELYSMGVATTFRKGSKFVPGGLRLPQNPSDISPAVVHSLLICIRNLADDLDKNLVSPLLEKLNHKWIKTQAGYRCPKECLLFSPKWRDILKLEDGPFIDEKFYGPDIVSYTKELEALGVVVDVKNGCSLVADYLDVHSNCITINRIYSYLNNHGWPSSCDVSAKIWIPNGENSGKWVNPEACVLHDKTNIFGSELFVLEKYYSNELLVLFGKLGVNSNPALEDYIKLWKTWEECAERRLLQPSECCAFWEFVVKHWSSRTQKFLAENLSKLPVCSGQDGILLLDKRDVFIADDLLKKDLFENSCGHPLFVWYPEPSLPSLPRTKLINIYREIGVPALSESAQNIGLSSIDCSGLERANPEMIFIGKNLFKLILGFLAQPILEIEAEKRHESLRRLVETSFFKLKEPITVDYRLLLSSGKILTAKASRMMRWERESSKFFIAELEKSDGCKGVLEYATYYSEEVSKGILWEKEDEVRELAELIKLGYILNFDEEAIDFLMKTKNLQVFKEDELFLSSVFAAE